MKPSAEIQEDVVGRLQRNARRHQGRGATALSIAAKRGARNITQTPPKVKQNPAREGRPAKDVLDSRALR